MTFFGDLYEGAASVLLAELQGFREVSLPLGQRAAPVPQLPLQHQLKIVGSDAARE